MLMPGRAIVGTAAGAAPERMRWELKAPRLGGVTVA